MLCHLGKLFPMSFCLFTGCIITALDNDRPAGCSLELQPDTAAQSNLTADKCTKVTVRPTTCLIGVQADLKKSTASHSTQTKPQTVSIGMGLEISLAVHVLIFPKHNGEQGCTRMISANCSSSHSSNTSGKLYTSVATFLMCHFVFLGIQVGGGLVADAGTQVSMHIEEHEEDISDDDDPPPDHDDPDYCPWDDLEEYVLQTLTDGSNDRVSSRVLPGFPTRHVAVLCKTFEKVSLFVSGSKNPKKT